MTVVSNVAKDDVRAKLGRQALLPAPGTWVIYVAWRNVWPAAGATGALYVGRSCRFLERMVWHRSYSDWWRHALRITVVTAIDRDHAIKSELRLIESLNPAFNLSPMRPATRPEAFREQYRRERLGLEVMP